MENTPGWGLKIEYMKDDYLKKIDQYFNRELDEQELTDFQQALSNDKELNAAFQARQGMEDFLAVRPNREKLKANIEALEQDFFTIETATPKVAKRRFIQRNIYWLGGAAAAVLLLIFALPLLLDTTPKYSDFATHRPLALQERGATDSPLSAIETAFNNKNYQEAYDQLASYVSGQKEDINAQLYQGIAALEIGKTAEAKAIFTRISEGESGFKQTASWYLALVSLQEQDYPAVRAILQGIPDGNYWYPKAQQLLSKLPEE